MKYYARSKTPKHLLSGFTNRFGLCCLLVLLILNPFHFVVSKHFSYYRELLAMLFTILLFLKNRKILQKQLYKSRPELVYLILFCMLLIPFAATDPGKNLYHTDPLLASLFLKNVSPVLYVLRNALLYIPMVFYFAVRGLTEGEIRWIAMISVLIAPFSVIQFLISSELATLQTLGSIVELGGHGLSYNTYVPYLTFPAISAMYLISANTGRPLKMIAFTVLIALSIYIIISSGRQSLLFLLIGGSMFFLIGRDISIPKKVGLAVLIIFAGAMFFNWLSEGYKINEKISNRLSTVTGFVETSRFEIAKRGLFLLKPHEHFIGAGLTSVIVSGPHNDYVRWWQRVGLFTMIIGFLPFLIAARKAYERMRISKYNALSIFIFLTICFTLYHSLFGYPREDAFQAPYCFLGLAIALGIEQVRRLNPRSHHQPIVQPMYSY